MKSKRQEKILELIADHSVQTQEQLLAELNEAGFCTTQATISRDIKQLRIIKELGPNGIYRYATAPKPAEHTFSAKLNLIFRQCITSVEYAQNMIVVKTMPGLANGAAAALHHQRGAGGRRRHADGEHLVADSNGFRVSAESLARYRRPR